MPLSERDNFMMVINGETPEWVPRYGMFGADPYAKYPLAVAGVMSSVIPFNFNPENRSYTDIFGVEYVATKETGWASLPVPGKFILDDIRKWPEIIAKLPDLSNVDWEAVCKSDVEKLPYNPKDFAMTYGGVGGMGFFMPLMDLMGFTNGLIAMSEEPEEVAAFFDALADWYCLGIKNTIDRYPVDIFTTGDDTAAAQQPFMSPKAYHDLIKPYVARTTKFAQDRGLPVMMHCCGRCEDFLEDWIDFGVNSWNPAQVSNDLDGIKKKYGNKMVLIGCWDSQGDAGYHFATEDVVRQAVRDTIDRYAPGGGFMFWGSSYGPDDDPQTENRKRWITEEYEAYRAHPYK